MKFFKWHTFFRKRKNLEVYFLGRGKRRATSLIENQLDSHAVVAAHFPYVEGSFCHAYTAKYGSPH